MVYPANLSVVLRLAPSVSKDQWLVLAALALLAAPASAQTTVDLISNTGQVGQGEASLTLDLAQAFTTGNNSAGYKVTDISLRLGPTNDATTSSTITIHESSSDRPGTSIGTLTRSAALVDHVRNGWTNATGIDLAANRTYFMVFNGEAANSGLVRPTSSDSEDSGGASNWSIGDVSWSKSTTATSWIGSGTSYRIAVRGYAKAVSTPAAPTVSAVAGSSTSLAVSWTAVTGATSYDVRYRPSYSSSYSNGPQDVRGTSTTVTGLAASTAYGVQVRASNAEGDSAWSPASAGVGTNADDSALVRNTAQGGAFGTDTLDSNVHYAQLFTTGDNASGYTLSSIEVVSADSNGDVFAASVYTVGSNNRPNSEHAALTSPGSHAAGPLTFAAPAGTELAAETIYAVVLAANPGVSVDLDTTASDSEDAGGTSGWSIADAHNTKQQGSWNAPSTSGRSVRIAVHGTAKASLPPLAPDRPAIWATPRTSDSLTVNWTAPDNTGRADITHYDLRYRPQTFPASDWTDGPQDQSAGPVTITGLVQGDYSGVYEVQVRDVNSARDGPW